MEMRCQGLQSELGHDQEMKSILFTLSAAMMLLTISCGENKNCDGTMTKTESKCENVCDSSMCCNATAEEIAGIRKALDLYCEASVKGDSKIAEPAFSPTATMSYAEDGKLVSVPIKALFDYYDQTGPQPASYEITSCNVATDAAIVSIDSKFGEIRFADMFTLVKDGNDWKIISKIYHVK